MNEQLREHVTSIGFALTLSKRQIQLLSLLHYYGSYDRMHASDHPHRMPHFITTARSLLVRGLVRHDNGWWPTKAGCLVADLLAEAGLYQEALEACGIDLAEQVAS